MDIGKEGLGGIDKERSTIDGELKGGRVEVPDVCVVRCLGGVWADEPSSEEKEGRN